MAVPHQQVSRTAGRALEQFSEDFRRALVSESYTPWASMLGLSHTTDALKTTWPIPLDAAGYRELKGDIKYRSLYNRAISLVSREFSDGVKEKARVIEAPDFIGWGEQPAIMASQWQRLPNELVAEMLALDTYNGPLLDLYKDPDVSGSVSTRRLFASDHPYNVLKPSLGTFDNTATTTVAAIQDGSLFDALELHFSGIKNARGNSMGLGLGGVLIPRVRKPLFKRALEPDLLVRTIQEGGANVAAVNERNIHQGLTYWVGDELTSGDYFYGIAAPKPGLKPWISLTNGAPEELINDKDSDLYKTSRHVSVAYVGEAEVGAALPHPIIRVQITG